MMKCIVTDDHALVRKGIMRLVTDAFPDAMCYEAGDSKELFELLKTVAADIILLDLSMPGTGGLDILKQMNISYPAIPVLVVSMHAEELYAIRTLKAGAMGYLNKDTAPEELVSAIHVVLSGKKYISQKVASELANEASTPKGDFNSLSDRETQVMMRLSKGMSLSEISSDLHISITTVSTYRTRVLEKLGLKSNAEITRYVIERGLDGDSGV